MKPYLRSYAVLSGFVRQTQLKTVLSCKLYNSVLAGPSFTVTNLCDSRQSTEPSLQSMTPLFPQLMTVKQLGADCNWNISVKLQDKSTLLQPLAPPLMYACPLLSLDAHGSYLSLSGTSGKQRCHTGSLLDYPHCVSLWPLSSRDDTGSSSQGADLTHSPQSTATSHMPASSVIPTQH